jgi:hypothetical protein
VGRGNQRITRVHLFCHIHRQLDHVEAFATHMFIAQHHVIRIAVGFWRIADNRHLIRLRQRLDLFDAARF